MRSGRIAVLGRLVHRPQRFAHAVLEALRDVLQQHVAERVAEGVVDAREVVEVQHQDRDSALPRCHPADHLLDELREALAVRQTRERIVVGEIPHASFAGAQLVLRLLGAHQELDALGEQHWIHALRGEVRGPRGIRRIHGLHVVETGLHEDGQVTASGHRADRRTHRITGEPGHDDVEHHAIAGLGPALRQSRLAVRGRPDAKPDKLQCGSHEQKRRRIIVHHQHVRRHHEVGCFVAHWHRVGRRGSIWRTAV